MGEPSDRRRKVALVPLYVQSRFFFLNSYLRARSHQNHCGFCCSLYTKLYATCRINHYMFVIVKYGMILLSLTYSCLTVHTYIVHILMMKFKIRDVWLCTNTYLLFFLDRFPLHMQNEPHQSYSVILSTWLHFSCIRTGKLRSLWCGNRCGNRNCHPRCFGASSPYPLRATYIYIYSRIKHSFIYISIATCSGPKNMTRV